jgi:hypothetical protein
VSTYKNKIKYFVLRTLFEIEVAIIVYCPSLMKKVHAGNFENVQRRTGKSDLKCDHAVECETYE